MVSGHSTRDGALLSGQSPVQVVPDLTPSLPPENPGLPLWARTPGGERSAPFPSRRGPLLGLPPVRQLAVCMTLVPTGPTHIPGPPPPERSVALGITTSICHIPE